MLSSLLGGSSSTLPIFILFQIAGLWFQFFWSILSFGLSLFGGLGI